MNQSQRRYNSVEYAVQCRTGIFYRLRKMTSHRIGVNLRVSGNCDQGGRKYMEDYHAIKFVKKDDRDYEFAYFGIFDGHGGPEASRFARDNLLNEITKYDQFWGDDDEEIKFAIRNGFLDTHTAMWKELDNWPRTVSGLPSTSGTTASIAIVKKGKLYVGHVGDSGIVLGCDEGPRNAIFMKPLCLTKDHKPDNPEEKERIEKCGGAVVAKAGVQRVVWSRPKVNHKGPVRRSTQIDKIPFLAVARSLGDLWSYDYYKGQFVVSPEPDVSVMALEPGKHRSMILGSDGLWNMLTPHEAVSVVTDLEMHFEDRVIHDPMVSVSYWINPAEKLVTRALNKWRAKLMKADNISCIVVLIDPLGPSKLTLLRKRREEHFSRLTQDAKANNNTITKKGATMSSSSSSLSLQGPTTSSATTKANHNQNNLGGRENKCGSGGPADKDAHRSSSTHNKGDSDADAENKSQEEEGEAMTTGHSNHTSPGNSGGGGGGGGGSSNSFVGRDITSTTNQTAVRGGHVLRSATHTSPTASRMPPKAASASKVRSLGRASFHRGQHGASGSSDTRQPLVPRRVSALFPGDLMDDSVQATSALNSLSPMGFNMTLSPTVEDPGCPGSRTPPLGDRSGLNTAALNLMSPVTMSSSLLKLMSLDAVKAQSSPPVPRSQASSSSAPNLRTTDAAGTGGQAAADARDGRRHRRSSQGVPRNFALPPHQQSSFFVSSALLAASSVAERSAPSQPSSLSLTEANKTFHSVLSLKMNRDTSSAHATRSLDTTFHSTRVLRPGTPQRAGSASSGGMVVTTERHRHQPASSSSHSKAKDRHADSSKSLRGLSVHSSSGGSTRKAKKRLGLLNRTRSTLRRARDAARKALCPENRALFKQLPGAKRKSTERHNAPGTPSSKRLRRSDGHS